MTEQDQWKVVSATGRKIGVRNSDGFICFMTDPGRYGDPDRYLSELKEMMGRAHLIAASPALLDACKGALKDLSYTLKQLYGHEEDHGTVKKLIAAIAQAEVIDEN